MQLQVGFFYPSGLVDLMFSYCSRVNWLYRPKKGEGAFAGVIERVVEKANRYLLPIRFSRSMEVYWHGLIRARRDRHLQEPV